jgi:long-chain fatty acid transport protein
MTLLTAAVISRVKLNRLRSFWLRRSPLLIWTLFAVLLTASSAQSSGFALVQQGTAAMAQGNAFVATADDASAIFYNPAGLNQLKSAQFYLGTFLNHPDREFAGSGQFSETNHRWYHSMSLYFAAPVTDRVALGIGFFSPFGMGTAWPPEWAGRYITTFSTLKTYQLNPVISVKPLENLSLAAGFDVLWSKVQLKKKFPVAFTMFGQTFKLGDGETDLTGGGYGFGYNLAALYEPITGVKFGVSYRSPIAVTHRGNLETKTPLPLPPPDRDTGSADLTFPPSVTMGISYSRLQPFSFEFDTTWTGWSTYDAFRLNLLNPILVNGELTSRLDTPKQWHDAWAFRFGGSYEIWEGAKIRAGYIYDMTPVPDKTFDPQVPDANRHIFTVGGDMKIKRFTLGLAYNYILSEDRTKNNQIVTNGVPAPLQANGKYSSDVHSLALSCAFNF